MAESSSGDSFRYTVRFDPNVNRAFDIGYTKKSARHWVFAGLRRGLLYAALAAFLIYTGTFKSRDDYFAIIGMPLIIGLLIAFVESWESIRSCIETQNQSLAGETWECEITADYWTTTDRKGLRVHYPWKQMEITYESLEGWIVRCGGTEVVVYRAPLRAAGLEDEFLKRIRDMADFGSGC